MKWWPLVWRSTYDRVVKGWAAESELWAEARRDSDVQLAVARTQTVAVSDAQVQTVVAAIDRAADEIVAAVKSVP
jgi:hypothetical protein